MTHTLANTVALALAVVLVPALALHRLQGRELVGRAAGAMAFRLCSDLASCYTLEHTSAPICGARFALWDSRLEFLALHGWCYRALASICPVIVVASVL